MRLIDGADGVKGHYCIGRLMAGSDAYWEFYNHGKWESAGQVFTRKETAEAVLEQLERHCSAPAKEVSK